MDLHRILAAAVVVLFCGNTFHPNVAHADTAIMIVRMERWLANQLIAAIIPPSLDSATGKIASVLETIYCGSVNGTGKAIMLLGAPGAQLAQVSLTYDDCGRDLKVIQSSHDDGIAIAAASVSLQASPYQVRLTIDGVAVKPQSALETASIQILSFSPVFPLSALPIESGFIREKWSALLKFDTDKIAVGIFNNGAQPSPGWDNIIGVTGVDPLRNVQIFISHKYLSNFFQQYRENFVFSIPNPNARISRIDYAGGANTVIASCQVHSDTVNDDASISIALSGDDLKVTTVSVSPQLENCGQLPLPARAACLARNAGHSAFAHAVEAFLNPDLQGKYLRPSSITRPVKINALGSSLKFVVSVHRSFATADYLALVGGAALE